MGDLVIVWSWLSDSLTLWPSDSLMPWLSDSQISSLSVYTITVGCIKLAASCWPYANGDKKFLWVVQYVEGLIGFSKVWFWVNALLARQSGDCLFISSNFFDLEYCALPQLRFRLRFRFRSILRFRLGFGFRFRLRFWLSFW